MNTQLPVLAGRRVRLEQLTERHLPEVGRWRRDEEVTRYWITRKAPTDRELEEWLAENRRTGSWTWIVYDERANAVGYIDVFAISVEHRHCEISLMIGERSAQGRGYGQECLRVVLAYLFSGRADGGPGMHRVSLTVVDQNAAARRVYERCGFVVEGRLREDMWIDGAWHDQLVMSVLDREFAEVMSSTDLEKP